jgi:hypothetical protein
MVNAAGAEPELAGISRAKRVALVAIAGIALAFAVIDLPFAVTEPRPNDRNGGETWSLLSRTELTARPEPITVKRGSDTTTVVSFVVSNNTGGAKPCKPPAARLRNLRRSTDGGAADVVESADIAWSSRSCSGGWSRYAVELNHPTSATFIFEWREAPEATCRRVRVQNLTTTALPDAERCATDAVS